MRIVNKLLATIIIFVLSLGSFMVCALKGTTPGYKLINTYNEADGTIITRIYVFGGYGAVGQVGIYYNTDLLDICAYVNKEYTTEYDINKMSITNFVQANRDKNKGIEPTITPERNEVSDLIGEETGEIFFAWYTGVGKNIDAREEDKCFAAIKFVLADGVTVEDLENAGTELIKFASEKPSDTDIGGYKSGVCCDNEESESFRNSAEAVHRITLGVKFEGLDIDASETITVKVLDNNGNPYEGAYVKIGGKEYRTNSDGEVILEVSGEYVVYYKQLESDNYQGEFGKTTVKISPPSKPEDLMILSGTKRFNVSWSKPLSTGGSNITKYIVSYTADGGEEEITEVDGETVKCVLEGLSEGVEYSIKVKAVNIIGEGEYCDVQKATTNSEGSDDGGDGTYEKYSGVCGSEGDNLTWALDTETGLLSIVGSGDMASYKYSVAPWYIYKKHIKKVEIGKEVTSIGEDAFFDCTNLTKVFLRSEEITMKKGVFKLCRKATLYGLAGSPAEAYAAANGIPFIPYGDVDIDDKITARDVQLYVKALAEQNTVSLPFERADMNFDGIIDFMDLNILLRTILNKINLSE